MTVLWAGDRAADEQREQLDERVRELRAKRGLHPEDARSRARVDTPGLDLGR